MDVVMEVAGVLDLILIGFKCLCKGGWFVEIGNLFLGVIFIYDVCDIIWCCLSIVGVYNYDIKYL